MKGQYHRILAGVQVEHMLMALQSIGSGLWNEHRIRTGHPGSAHAEVDDILLRFQPMPEPGHESDVVDAHESVDYPAYDALGHPFRRAIMNVFAYVGGDRLGRVLVTRLKPGGKIAPHVDAGLHAEYYDRFHLCLQADLGSQFRIGDDWVVMAPGELWWVNNAIDHEVVNHGSIDRIHLVIDAHCRNWVEAVYGPSTSPA